MKMNKNTAMIIAGVVVLFLVYWFFFRKKTTKTESGYMRLAAEKPCTQKCCTSINSDGTCAPGATETRPCGSPCMSVN